MYRYSIHIIANEVQIMLGKTSEALDTFGERDGT